MPAGLRVSPDPARKVGTSRLCQFSPSRKTGQTCVPRVADLVILFIHRAIALQTPRNQLLLTCNIRFPFDFHKALSKISDKPIFIAAS